MIVDGVVIHERWYPHPPERVWEALSDPAALASWLMPNDASLGHRGGFSFDGGNHYGRIAVEIVEQDAPRSLRWSWTIAGEASEVSIMLEARDGGTALRLEHRALGPDDSTGFDGGWADKLDHDLVELLADRRRPSDVTWRDGYAHHPALDLSSPGEDA
jgi:uncharacterized protein YndB with AHSA1/START domain